MSNKKKNKNKNQAVKATPVKAKKNRKKMDPKKKEMVKVSFMTLINNDACLKVAREYRGAGWAALAIGLGLLSVVLADVPTLSSQLSVNFGDSVLGAPNYSLDQELATFSKELSEKGVTLEIKDGKPSVQHWDNVVYTVEGENGPEKQTWYADYSSSLDKIVFEVFVNSVDAGGMTVEDSVFFARITSAKDPLTGNVRPGYGGSDASYATNFVAFGQENIMVGRYNENGKGSTITGITADLEGTKFSEFANETKNGLGEYPEEKEFVRAITAKWKDVIVRSTDRQKISSSWTMAGITAAIYVGIEVLFGLVVFLLTRGKRNPFRIYTFWETQKISYWAGVAPALLSLAFGFAMPSFAMMSFIVLFGLRLMWLSMKTMRPAA